MYINPFYLDTKEIFKNLPVDACYLYGSHAQNNENKESDYDIAVFVKDRKKINLREFLKKIITFFKYPEKLHLKIIDLKTTSSLLLYQIIKKGKLIYEKESNYHIKLESYIMRLYFDDQKRQEIYFQKLKKYYVS